ncbi:YciI family protein [Variovorax sp. E3]
MDGPFAETKEHLGGYYVIDVADLDVALKYAQAVPSASFGTVEVRPLMDYNPAG